MQPLIRLFFPCLLFAGPAAAQNTGSPPAQTGVLHSGRPLLLATEQLKDRFMIIDPGSNQVVWEWVAPDDREIPAERKKWFTNPSDAKSTADKSTILFTCSGGAVGALDVKTRKLIWYTYSGSNPHSVEPLPDGNTAAASSTGNFVKIIPTAGERGYIDSARFVKDTLTFAHNVVWDQGKGLLWSAGLREIVAFKYPGLPGDQSVRQRNGLEETVRIRLPDPDGHDLVRVNDSTLILSTDHNLWLFNTRTGLFSPYTGCVPRKGIKSISFSGTSVILVYPNEVWWSDRIYNGDGSVLYQLDKARFYKVRYF